MDLNIGYRSDDWKILQEAGLSEIRGLAGQ